MKKRITLITLLEKESQLEIERLIKSIDSPTCKVPYGVCENRLTADTLPYHFTISAWSESQKSQVLDLLKEIEISKIKLKVNKVGIMTGKENSRVLYFSLTDDSQLRAIQREIFNKLPTEKYNPDTFTFHMTIAIEKETEKIRQLKTALTQNFQPFDITVNALGLFEIYPAVKIIETKSK